MFHLGKFGHLEFWIYVETADHVREVPGSESCIDYLGLLWAYYKAYPLQHSDVLKRRDICTSLTTNSGEPPIVMSSRYQTFSSDSTPLAI